MPELPDVELYRHALQRTIGGAVVERVRVANPFTVRTYDPPVTVLEGRRVDDISRLGKRLVFDLGDDFFMVLHLMVAGRLRWRERGAPVPGKVGLAAFDFADGSLILTEAGSKRQASIHVVRGRTALQDHDRGGLEVLEADLPAFAERLTRENHTLKRALTDPHIFSGIGNAYSDEILHAAGLSPMKQVSALSDTEIERLYHATRDTLRIWIDRLRRQAGDAFPEKVTAFHDEMAVHGRFGKPCPVCEEPVQRIVYATNEANYCARCQTGGRLLSDRALSRLLGQDWPKTLEEMENRRKPGRETGAPASRTRRR